MLGEAMPPDLEMANRAAEGGSLRAVIERLADRSLGAGQRENRGREPLTLEVVHHVVEALVHLPEHIALWDTASVEKQLGRVGRHVADLAQLLADREALGFGRKQNQRDALVAIRAGADRQDDEVRASS